MLRVCRVWQPYHWIRFNRGPDWKRGICRQRTNRHWERSDVFFSLSEKKRPKVVSVVSVLFFLPPTSGKSDNKDITILNLDFSFLFFGAPVPLFFILRVFGGRLFTTEWLLLMHQQRPKIQNKVETRIINFISAEARVWFRTGSFGLGATNTW